VIHVVVLLMAFVTPFEFPISPVPHVPPDIQRFNGIPIAFDRDMLSGIKVDDSVLVPRFPLTHDRWVDLELERFDVFTSDAIVTVASIDIYGQIVERTVDRPDVVLLQGTIMGEPESSVFLAIGKHTTNGWLKSRGTTYIIGENSNAGWTVVYDLDAVDPALMNWVDVQCGVTEDMEISLESQNNKSQQRSGVIDCPALRMAIETDWQFTGNLFGGNTAASGEYAATLIGAVSTIYESDVDIETKISFLRLWESSSDPWSGGNSQQQLGEFVSYWNINMDHVDRHVAHMLSGQNIGGGIAYLSALCTSAGYAVSGNLSGSFPLPIEDHNSNNWDLMVVAHETGHNCGAPHTHNYTPPIDSCGLGDCSEAWGGTIMSYCHTCSGGMSNMVMSFHPIVQSTIINYLPTIPCSLGGDGSPPVAPLDTVWAMYGDTIDIDVLANDYVNDCTFPQLIGTDTISHLGGTIEMIGADPATAILRYTPPQEMIDIDIFQYVIRDQSGQESTGGVILFLGVPRPADNPVSTESGVKVSYYALDNPSVLPNFYSLTPIGDEIVSQVNYSSTGGNFAGSGLADDVGAVFEGYIEVPETDLYTLFVDSDDGSRLFIGNEVVVNNDGLHGMLEVSGQISLAVGSHEIRVEFFERGGGAGCIVRIASTTMLKQVIPISMWSHSVSVYGDINGDGVVNVNDLLLIINAWGECGDPCEADLTNDGVVDVNDLLEVIAAWS